MYARMQRADVEHEKTMTAVQNFRRLDALRKNALQLPAEAEARDRGLRPTMTEARLMEVAGVAGLCGSGSSGASELRVTEKLRDEAMEAHEEMMRAILHAGDTEGDEHV